MIQHTPTPWNTPAVTINDSSKRVIAICTDRSNEENKANAAFIVRAANEYDKLKSENEEKRSLLKIAAERQRDLYMKLEKLEAEKVDLQAKAYAAAVAAGNERMKNNSLEKKLNEAVAFLKFIDEEDLLPMAFAMEDGNEIRDAAKEFLAKMKEKV